ncbi:MAG: SCO family protein [Chitinophagaceae bacterium]
MKRSNKTIPLFLFIAVVCPVVAFAIVHWYENTVQELPYFGKEYQLAGNTKEYYTITDFSFPNELGGISNLDSVKGKVWIANYFFSNCKTICPVIMPNLAKVQQAYKGNVDFKMFSFSVDPERDSAGRLQEYARQLGVDPNQWHLLTGDKKSLYRFARNQLFITATDGDGGPDDFIHSDRVVLVDKAGHIRGYYDGTNKTEMQQLTKDIQKLLK